MATVLGCFLTAVWLVVPTLLTYANLPADMAEVKASAKDHTSSLADMKYELLQATANTAAARDAAAAAAAKADAAYTLTRLIEANQEMTMRRGGIEPLSVNSLLPSASLTPDEGTSFKAVAGNGTDGTNGGGL